MSTKGFTIVTSKNLLKGDILGSWNLKAGDTAVPLLCPRYSDKSVHIFGTFGGASVTLQGTNDPALAVYGNIYDSAGTDITQAAAGKPWVILPNVYAIKPVITGGDGTTNLTIAIIGRGAH